MADATGGPENGDCRLRRPRNHDTGGLLPCQNQSFQGRLDGQNVPLRGHCTTFHTSANLRGPTQPSRPRRWRCTRRRRRTANVCARVNSQAQVRQICRSCQKAMLVMKLGARWVSAVKVAAGLPRSWLDQQDDSPPDVLWQRRPHCQQPCQLSTVLRGQTAVMPGGCRGLWIVAHYRRFGCTGRAAFCATPRIAVACNRGF